MRYSTTPYQELASRVRQNRMKQEIAHPRTRNLKTRNLKIRKVPEAFLARTQKEILKPTQQHSFPFINNYQALDIYHQFDPQAREVEWSFYSESGEFLLQFGFSLKNHEYQVYAAHPGLWVEKEKLNHYLPVIQNSLAEHYPPLKLIHKDNGEVEVCGKE